MEIKKKTNNLFCSKNSKFLKTISFNSMAHFECTQNMISFFTSPTAFERRQQLYAIRCIMITIHLWWQYANFCPFHIPTRKKNSFTSFLPKTIALRFVKAAMSLKEKTVINIRDCHFYESSSLLPSASAFMQKAFPALPLPAHFHPSTIIPLAGLCGLPAGS